MADTLEITKEIIVAMIQHNKILPGKIEPNSTSYNNELNKSYNDEVSKAIKSVHSALIDAGSGK